MPDAYIICGTPRTGSTLLCRLLASTGSAGDPDSFFRRQDMPSWAGEWGLPAREAAGEPASDTAYLRAAIAAGTSGTGVFGLRLMRENLEELGVFLDRIFPRRRSDLARLEAAFGRILFIHLSREDRLAQAVSLIRAEQTGLWHVAPDGTEIERLAPPGDPRYDFARIRRTVGQLERSDRAWTCWFGQQGIAPLRISYEALSADPAAAVIGICKVLHVPAPSPDAVEPGVARLSDATSREWMRRYRADMARIA